jgi:hypothetical protein
MKKSKLSLGLVTGLMAVGALAGCGKVKSSGDGFLLIVNGDKEHPLSITADKILGDYYNDSTKYQAIYDTVYSIIVKNYFETVVDEVNYYGTTEVHGKSDKADLVAKAQQKVKDDEEKAKTNAKSNGTKEKDEFQSILDSNGVEDKDELEAHYLYELEKEKFEENFYKYHIEEIKNGQDSNAITYKDSEGDKNMWRGYFEQEVPYHVSHILVKLEDSSGTNYSNGTISKANAIKLAEVVEALGEKDKEDKDYYDSFGTVAFEYSEDGSKDLYGDLGIMDYSTNYVNEFKLGIYAYENFYYSTNVRTAGSEIDLVSDTSTSGVMKRYKDEVKESFGLADVDNIPTIDKKVFVELKEAAEKETDSVNHESVLEGSSTVFPRNVIYNKHLNRHEVAFITDESGDDELNLLTTKKTVGYVSYSGDYRLASLGKPVLSTKIDGEWMPILCVRAGSDYQGVHFIVVNRSAFEKGGSESVHKVEQSKYYTTFYPKQTNYPKDSEGNNLKTYINFSSENTDKTMSRASEFESKLKSFDSEKLQKYIFRKYKEAGQIKIADANLESALTKWIDSSIEKKVEERSDSWTKTWNDYLDTLSRQNSERKNRIPEICKLGFDFGNSENSLYDELKASDDYPTVTDKATFEAFVDEYAEELVELFNDKFAAKADAFDYLETTAVEDWFNVKGGICNDGKKHD